VENSRSQTRLSSNNGVTTSTANRPFLRDTSRSHRSGGDWLPNQSMRIGGWRQIGAHRQKFDAPAPWHRHFAWSLAACAMVRHRMFSGVSLAPGFRVLMSSTTYPGQAPFTDPVVGQGCLARNARTGAGFREICPVKSRTQLRQVGVWPVRGGGNLETMLNWAFRMAQAVRANVPRRNGSRCFEGIAQGCAR
jgi:hypothetical protein